MYGMGIDILQMIPVRIVDTIMIDSGVVLQVVAEVVVALYRISRSRKQVGIGMHNHLAENCNQDQQSCAQDD